LEGKGAYEIAGSPRKEAKQRAPGGKSPEGSTGVWSPVTKNYWSKRNGARGLLLSQLLQKPTELPGVRGGAADPIFTGPGGETLGKVAKRLFLTKGKKLQGTGGESKICVFDVGEEGTAKVATGPLDRATGGLDYPYWGKGPK